jgi:hypothetical protein
MSTAADELRLRFYSQTDIELEVDNAKWKQYALWLENLKTTELTDELVKINQRYDHAIQSATNMLEGAYQVTPRKEA